MTIATAPVVSPAAAAPQNGFSLISNDTLLHIYTTMLKCRLLQQRIGEVQKMLDHKLLNKIEALGPPTLENLSRFVWERVQHAGRVTRVTIHRDSCGESCTYYGPQG